LWNEHVERREADDTWTSPAAVLCDPEWKLICKYGKPTRINISTRRSEAEKRERIEISFIVERDRIDESCYWYIYQRHRPPERHILYANDMNHTSHLPVSSLYIPYQ